MDNHCDTNRALPWFMFFLLFVIFAIAQPFNFRFSADYDPVGDVDENLQHFMEGNIYRRFALLALAIVALVALWLKSENRVRIQGWLGWSILLFVAWCFASILWSEERSFTLQKIAVLGLMWFGAVGVAKWFSKRDLLWFVLSTTLAVLVLGFCSEIALGTFKPWQTEYRFTGLTWHSFSAWNFSLLVLAIFALLGGLRSGHNLLIAIATAAIVLIILAKTRAAAAAFVSGLVLYIGLTWTARKMLLAGALTCFSVAALLFTAEAAGTDISTKLLAAANLGRETESVTNLTGRTEIWSELMPYIAARPLTGCGYGSFWSREHLMEFARKSWAMADSHNGLIEITLGTGIVGLILFLVVMLLGMWRVIVGYKKTSDPYYAFAGSALIVAFVNALAVGIVFAPYLNCFITVLVLAHLGFVEHAPDCELPKHRSLAGGRV